jgi:CubicO group peptidase (beta-lactamase class C family)
MSANEIMTGFPPPPSEQVTLANWRLPPFNRWAFRNVRQILPTAAIPRSETSGEAFRRAGRTIETIAFQGPDGQEWTVGRMLAATFTDGLMALRRGRIVAERYDSGLLPETPHIVFSVSKSLTAFLAGILVGQGRLDPEAPVVRYIPEVAGSAYGDCTVRHVLDMTVSTDFIEDYLDTTGDFARYRMATGWNPVADPSNVGDLRGFLPSIHRGAGPHGQVFHYVSPNSDLLGWILERASARPFAELMSELIWRPLGAEFDAYITVDRLGAPRSAGGICVTLRDLARFGEMMRLRGMAGGRQIAPAWWIDDIRENGDPGAWRRGALASQLPLDRYRSKWYSLGDGRGTFCAIGIHGQWLFIDPTAEVVLAKFSSQPVAVDEAADRLTMAGLAALARAMAGRP